MNRTLMKGVMSRLAGSMVVAVLAVGVLGSPQAVAGIKDTKHNLGSSASTATRVNTFSGTQEICVFCHTPHGADTGASIPLWNRTNTTTPATYQTYNSLGTSSLDGATAPVGSVSLACLSCHDGTQAMNSMINAPGSGLAGNAAWQAGTWAGGNTTGVIGTSITNIGTDLRNDHPIGIQYAGGPKAGDPTKIPATGVYPQANFRDADFHDAQSATLNGKQAWWVDTGTANGTREKTDIQLYARGSLTAVNADGSNLTIVGAQPFVECASCHDPHSSNDTFLRIPNTGSAVCLACHDK